MRLLLGRNKKCAKYATLAQHRHVRTMIMKLPSSSLWNAHRTKLYCWFCENPNFRIHVWVLHAAKRVSPTGCTAMSYYCSFGRVLLWYVTHNLTSMVCEGWIVRAAQTWVFLKTLSRVVWVDQSRGVKQRVS